MKPEPMTIRKATEQKLKPDPRVRYGDLPVGACFKYPNGTYLIRKSRTSRWDINENLGFWRAKPSTDDCLVCPVNAEIVILWDSSEETK